MATEFRIKHDRLSDPKTVTQVTRDEFRRRGLNTGVNVVHKIEDDGRTGERVYKVRNSKVFDMGRGR